MLLPYKKCIGPFNSWAGLSLDWNRRLPVVCAEHPAGFGWPEPFDSAEFKSSV